jgi:hypothetical protein
MPSSLSGIIMQNFKSSLVQFLSWAGAGAFPSMKNQRNLVKLFLY